jgi:predicted DNA-binding transcriptional regulator YafY
MEVSRTERLLNLVIALLAAGSPVPRSVVQRSVLGYDPESSVAAFERMFERDKDELRAMGIPITTVTDAHGEVQGYRIDAQDYQQRDIDLTVEELAVLSIAARVWDEAVLAPAATTALRKLEAISTVADAASIDVPATFGSVSASDAALLPLMRAIRDGRVVRFDYRKPQDAHVQQRTVEPWNVRSVEGRWYLVGWDRDRAQERVFRLSRIHGAVAVTAQAAPERSSVPEITLMVEPEDEIVARITIPDGTGGELRRLPGSTHLTGDSWEVRAPRFELVALLLRADESIVVQSPQDLRADVIASLERIEAAHS